VQVFGLKQPELSKMEYRTLDEALASKSLEITEVSESGSVPSLKLKNHADGYVFLMAGEQLIGAKQNRVLNTSMMVAGKSEVPIPVSCVEQGRWSYRSREFSSEGTSSHSILRCMMTGSVTASYERTSTPAANQGEVWGEVHRKLGAMKSHSSSSALEQTYLDHRELLAGLIESLPHPEGCCGAVFVIDGRIVGMDLFDQPQTLEKLWPKLIRGYAIDALERGEREGTALDASSVREWIDNATRIEIKPFPSPGLGEDVRMRSESLVGAGLVVDTQPIHVQLFTETKA
jgi:hypothetical protein